MMTYLQNLAFIAPDSSSSLHFGPKLLIKLQEINYLLWNQQVRDVILTQRMHKLVVNPHMPPNFKTVQDQAENNVSGEYEAWIVQDQAIFI